MTEGIFQFNRSFRQWLKMYSGVESITLTGETTFEAISQMIELFRYQDYKQITIDNLRIKYNGKIGYYKDFLQYCHHTDEPISPIEKVLANATRLKFIVYTNGNIIEKFDRKTLIHIPESSTIKIDENIEIIGNYCCYNYEKLNKLILHNNIIKIGEYAFHGTEIEELELPDSLIELGENAFDCNNLEKIILSNKLKSIPNYCFHGCELDEIHIPSSVKNIEYASLVSIYSDNIIIPEGVERIESYAFGTLFPDVKVYLPSTLKEIAPDFYYDDIVELNPDPPYIEIDKNNPIFYSKDGTLYFKSNNKCAIDARYKK